MNDPVLAYFEAIDAGNWDRVDDILSQAQQDEMLSAAIFFLHEKLEISSDVPYVRQIMKWREREKGSLVE